MRLNDGMPVWHVSVSVWSKRGDQVSAPDLAEKEAIRCLRGVGGQREWWLWNAGARIGHLRVAITPEENDALPCGLAIDDAGDTGPERPRTAG